MKPEDNFYYVLWAAAHDFPIVNGFSGFLPQQFEAIQAAMAARPIAPGAASLLAENGVHAILLHRGRAGAEEQSALSPFLASLVAAGRFRPVRVLGRGSRETLVFASPDSAARLGASDGDRLAVMDALAHPLPSTLPPQGWYFDPQNGAVFQGGTVRGAGWAAAEDGIARIEVMLDGKLVGLATYGMRRPEVPMVLPRIPCRELCGYVYRIDHVPPGRHELATRYVARNGGSAMPPAVEIRVR